jgi:hypothetical protein
VRSVERVQVREFEETRVYGMAFGSIGEDFPI